MADEDDTTQGDPNSGESATGAIGDALNAAVASADAEVASADAEMATPAIPVKAEPTALPERKVDAEGRSYATGKRKDAVARVWIKSGDGQLTVNGRDGQIYFARPTLQMIINQPFDAVDRKDQYDIWCTVRGGGLSGQAGAVRHGISKALTFHDPDLRSSLKKGGFLTRDARVVERKKYGKPKARRSFQFSKR